MDDGPGRTRIEFLSDMLLHSAGNQYPDRQSAVHHECANDDLNQVHHLVLVITFVKRVNDNDGGDWFCPARGSKVRPAPPSSRSRSGIVGTGSTRLVGHER